MDTDVSKHFADGLRDLAAVAQRVADSMGPDLERALTMVRETVARGGTLFFCGNGGSAADAQHIATEYVVRYARNRGAYPAVALDDRHLASHRGGKRFWVRRDIRETGRRAGEADRPAGHPFDERQLAQRAPRGRNGARERSARARFQRAETAASCARSPIIRSSFRRRAPTARRSCTSASST